MIPLTPGQSREHVRGWPVGELRQAIAPRGPRGQ